MLAPIPGLPPPHAAFPKPARLLHDLPESGGDCRGDCGGVLDLWVMPQVGKLLNRHRGTQLTHTVEPVARRSRNVSAPGKRQGILPVANRPMPALDESLTFA